MSVQEKEQVHQEMEMAPVSPVNKTGIAARLADAVDAAKPVNRSADLVPLNKEYDQMRKAMRALIVSAKTYQNAMANTDKARLDMTMKVSLLATKSPIFGPVGNMAGGDSVASVAQAASEAAQEYATAYKEKVIDYAVEWEQVVTTRVDAELKETALLQQRLNHYQTKVDNLRVKIHVLEEKSKSPSKSLEEKMDRNEEKLEEAWGHHERASSKLCNLLEEAVKRGWKDLYPLVKASVQFEVDRSSSEHDVFARLPAVSKDLTEAHDLGMNGLCGPQEPCVPVALEAVMEKDFETDSFNDEGNSTDSAGAIQEEERFVAPLSPKRDDMSKIDSLSAPASPRDVAQV